MGCDIHVYIEKRIDSQFPWEADEGHSASIEEAGTPDEHTYVNSVSAAGRNYNLFAILANVRGCGLLYDVRGLPTDVSPLIKQAYNQWGVDGHTHSYLSLDEFKECLVAAQYKLDRKKSSKAFFSWSEYNDFKKSPPDYVTMVNYCENWIDKIKEEDFLGIDEYRPEVRIVFWFDN